MQMTPHCIDSASFVLNERVGKSPKERDFEMIQVLNVSVGMQRQEANEDQVDCEQHPREDPREGQDKMKYEDC